MRNNKSNEDADGTNDHTPNRWRAPTGGIPTKSVNKKSIVIEPDQLSALVAGDHVEITTTHNQTIDGIVYCSIPQVPPLCIIR